MDIPPITRTMTRAQVSWTCFVNVVVICVCELLLCHGVSAANGRVAVAFLVFSWLTAIGANINMIATYFMQCGGRWASYQRFRSAHAHNTARTPWGLYPSCLCDRVTSSVCVLGAVLCSRPWHHRVRDWYVNQEPGLLSLHEQPYHGVLCGADHPWVRLLWMCLLFSVHLLRLHCRCASFHDDRSIWYGVAGALTLQQQHVHATGGVTVTQASSTVVNPLVVIKS
jgi:hypothetical protein